MKIFRTVSAGKFYWAVFTDDGKYLEDLTEYLIYCVDDSELNSETVRARAYILTNWISFLLSKNLDQYGASDNTLRDYRDYLVINKKANSSDDSKSRQRSVNQYIRVIYDFYHWAQFSRKAEYLLGPSDIYSIYSQLTLNSKKTKEYDNYPILFRRVASASKHRTTYTPDYQIFLTLYEHFISTHSAEVSERDCLILKMALESGLRVGSMASLTLADFDLEKIKASEDRYSITPSVQKFGMTNTFEITINLAMSVIEYIQGPRNEICKRFKVTSDHLFLSTTDGSNILSKSISSNFSKASKILGLPYRAGVHSWRGLFTENTIEYEIDARLELGFDTSIESIGMVIAKELGHSSPYSQQSYIRSLRSRHRSSQAFRHMKEIQNLRDQLLQFIKENENLRLEVEKLTKVKPST